MSRHAAQAILRAMLAHDAPAADPVRVVVAGAGVAGLETLVALRGLAGDRVAAVLVAPHETFTLRALDVFEPFGLGHPRRYDIAELTGDVGAAWLRDELARVERDRRTVVLRSGDELPYDVLVLALGAIPYPTFDHGVVFDRARRPDAFDELLADVRRARADSVAVVVPRARRGRCPPTSSRSCCGPSAAPGAPVLPRSRWSPPSPSRSRRSVRAGARQRARPYTPALRGLLRTGSGPRYVRAEPPGGRGECLVSEQCLWWPPTEVASRWLAPWLAARDLQAPADPPPRVLPGGGIARGSLSAK